MINALKKEKDGDIEEVYVDNDCSEEEESGKIGFTKS